MLQTIMILAEGLGVIAFAISGATLAAEHNMDIFGCWVMALVTSFGGGAIRDVFLGIHPPSMFNSHTMVLLATISAIGVFFIYRLDIHSAKRKLKINYPAIVNIFDAIGLAVFTVTGVNVAIQVGHGDNALLAITMGVLTGIGGGIIRDILNSEVPFVLCKHIYALAALIGAVLYYGLTFSHLPSLATVLIPSILVILIRIFATHYHWELPKAN